MKISINLPTELVAQIDRERGLVSRSAWITSLLPDPAKPTARVRDVINDALAREAEQPSVVNVRMDDRGRAYKVSRADAFHRATQR